MTSVLGKVFWRQYVKKIFDKQKSTFCTFFLTCLRCRGKKENDIAALFRMNVRTASFDHFLSIFLFLFIEPLR